MAPRPSCCAIAALLAVVAHASSADAQPAPGQPAPSGSTTGPAGAPPGQFGGGAPGQFQPPPGQVQPPTGQPPAGQTAAPAPGATTPAPSPFGGMSAGGLTPPSPTDGAPPTEPPAPSTDEDLDRARKEDAGRDLSWVWIELGGGFEHVGLQTFNVEEEAFSAGFIETSASGGVIDGGLGVRLLFLTLGARGRMGFFTPWKLGRIGGEMGLRIPIGRVEPRFDAGFGYAALSDVDSVLGDAVATDIDGYYARLGAGVDVFPKNWLSVGAGVSWELLGLTRSGLSIGEVTRLDDAAADDPEAAALSAEGSGYGSTIAITARAGLHF